METTKQEILRMLEELVKKIETAFETGSRTDEERGEKRRALIESFARAQRLVSLLDGGAGTKIAEARISNALDGLTRWDPERYMDGYLVTEIPRAIASIRQLTGSATVSISSPRTSVIDAVISRVIRLFT